MKESKKMMAKEVSFMKKKGAPKSMIKHEMAEAKGYKKGGVAESSMMKKEGRGMAKADMQKVAKKEVKGHEVKMHGAKKMMGGGMAKGYKSGGAVDGVAQRGKTKGTQIKMAMGGKAC